MSVESPTKVVTASGNYHTGSPTTSTDVDERRRRPLVSPKARQGTVGVLLLLLLAELITRLGIVSPEYLPYASRVVARTFSLVLQPDFLIEVGWTMLAWGVSMAVSILVGVPLGVAIGRSELVYRATTNLIEILRPIPAVALIPLAILLWGSGTGMKVALTTLATIWPVLFNTVYGVHDVDPVAIDTGRSFGFPRRAILGRIVMPSAAPFVLTGIRIAGSLGLVVVVGAELVAGTSNGIGAYILGASLAGDVTVVLAGAALAGAIGVAVNAALAALDVRLFAWAHVSERGKA